jgi:hypothetical protein
MTNRTHNGEDLKNNLEKIANGSLFEVLRSSHGVYLTVVGYLDKDNCDENNLGLNHTKPKEPGFSESMDSLKATYPQLVVPYRNILRYKYRPSADQSNWKEE